MKHFLRQFGEWFCVRFYFGDPAAQTAQSQQQHQQQAQQYAQQQQQQAQQALQQYLQQNRNPAQGWGGIAPPPGAGMAGGMTTGMGGTQGGNFNLAQMLGGMMGPQQGGMLGQAGGMQPGGIPPKAQMMQRALAGANQPGMNYSLPGMMNQNPGGVQRGNIMQPGAYGQQQPGQWGQQQPQAQGGLPNVRPPMQRMQLQ